MRSTRPAAARPSKASPARPAPEPGPASGGKPLLLVHGTDDYAVKQRAREVFRQWSAAVGGMDHETIDAQAGHFGEALRALGRLREALQTLPFFGSGKVVWFQNCSFLGDDRAATAAAVTEALADLGAELQSFSWQNVRLLISAGKVDKRRSFYRILEKLGAVEVYTAWSADDKDWAVEAAAWARRALRHRRQDIGEEALATLVHQAGPNRQQLASEIEKLSLYASGRATIDVADVQAVVTRNKQARAFALADAFGDRDLPRVLHTLDHELWTLRIDKSRSEIALLYGLITKVRAMLFLKEMIREGWFRADAEYGRFKSQLEGVPAGRFPDDKRLNPLAMHPYMLHRALGQTRHYTTAELVRAMERLLECNRQLVSRGLDEAMVLQQTLVHIVRRDA
ncbi:MAG: DNA polymerase III subunit delta [Verrucomicrobia bacterium]|nr:DNA polymerase III subunit delta [Verrucomicrobiota bacterium]